MCNGYWFPRRFHQTYRSIHADGHVRGAEGGPTLAGGQVRGAEKRSIRADGHVRGVEGGPTLAGGHVRGAEVVTEAQSVSPPGGSSLMGESCLARPQDYRPWNVFCSCCAFTCLLLQYSSGI